MQRVFTVTALEWDGDWILRAEVGEVDAQWPSDGKQWKTKPKSMSLDELADLIESPDTLVTSRTRSGTAGPNLTVHGGQNGKRTVRPIPIPGVIQDLGAINTIIK